MKIIRNKKVKPVIGRLSRCNIFFESKLFTNRIKINILTGEFKKIILFQNKKELFVNRVTYE